MLLKNSLLLSLYLIGLTGCGFKPIYGPSSYGSSFPNKEEHLAVAQDLSLIKISLIPDRKGQILRNSLIHLLTPKGQPGNPKYILEVTLTEATQALGILKDATYSRSQLVFTADFFLRDIATYKILFTSQATTAADYNFVISNQFATTIADDDAHTRGLTLLAQDIARQLAMFFSIPKETEKNLKVT